MLATSPPTPPHQYSLVDDYDDDDVGDESRGRTIAAHFVLESLKVGESKGYQEKERCDFEKESGVKYEDAQPRRRRVHDD